MCPRLVLPEAMRPISEEPPAQLGDLVPLPTCCVTLGLSLAPPASVSPSAQRIVEAASRLHAVPQGSPGLCGGAHGHPGVQGWQPLCCPPVRQLTPRGRGAHLGAPPGGGGGRSVTSARTSSESLGPWGGAGPFEAPRGRGRPRDTGWGRGLSQGCSRRASPWASCRSRTGTTAAPASCGCRRPPPAQPCTDAQAHRCAGGSLPPAQGASTGQSAWGAEGARAPSMLP